MPVLKSLAVWLVLVVVAILNGTLRERALIPALGRTRGLQVSGVVLSLLIFLVSLLAVPWFGRLGAAQYWLIGAFWLLLTEAFEFGFGRFVERKSWHELLRAYRLVEGNLWLVVLVVTLASPYLAAKARQLV